MKTELWFRNPKDYARELAEVGHKLIAWDRGMLQKRNIDPVAWANLYFGPGWRQLMIGVQGTMELDETHGPLNPVAVYPTWCYGQPTALLEEMLENPAGENESECFDSSIQVDERPVWGQKHRVVIAEGPPQGAQTSLGRKFYMYLHDLQKDFPDCELYVHNLYSFRFMFGLGFPAVDFDPRTIAQKGRLSLSSGEVVPYEQAQKKPKWLHAVGMTVKDIEVPRNRCIFNIRSALWAAENYNELYSFRVKSSAGIKPDTLTPQSEFVPQQTKSHLLSPKRALPGDMMACDSCSLRSACKYEREGAVCSVPDSEGSKLAKYFKTRDSGAIIDGLSEVLALQTERIEEGMAEEKIVGLNPEVTKMLSAVFAQGVQLAKLVDPSLRAGPKVAVNVTGAGSASVEVGPSSKALVAKVMRELELSGIAREDITPQMVEGVLAGMIDPSRREKAIEGTVISERDERPA